MPDDILIVEDEPDIVDFMRRVLQRAGYVVRSAGDGESALKAIADHLPALVLLDWMLPGVSGDRVLAQLHTTHPNLPIIVITGDPHSLHGLHALGIDKVLMKPFTLAELLDAVVRYRVADPNG